MEMAAPGGLSFRPRDDELIDLFLRRKLAGQPPLAAARCIHNLDVYSDAPEQLVDGLKAAPGTGLGDARVWYLFSPVRHCAGKRKARTIAGDKGWWHSEGGKKTVEGSAAAGCFQKFSFKVKTASGVVKPGWLMVEYSIGDADLVLCKVYRSPRAAARSRVVSSSIATAALSESAGCRKRKAEEEHPETPPPCSARRQMTDEEDDHALAFVESLDRDLTSSDYHDGPGEMLEMFERDGALMPLQPFEFNELLDFNQLDLFGGDGALMPLQPFDFNDSYLIGDMSTLMPFDFNDNDLIGDMSTLLPLELDLFGDPPQPCAQSQMTTEEVLEMSGHDGPGEMLEMFERDGAGTDEEVLEMVEEMLHRDIPLQPFEFNNNDLMSAGELVQTTTTVHGSCPGDATQVADACFDEEGLQLDEPAPGEFISGCRKRKAEEEHPETPPPCSARRQMTDEEVDHALAFVESLDRDLTSLDYHDDPEMLEMFERDGAATDEEVLEMLKIEEAASSRLKGLPLQ